MPKIITFHRRRVNLTQVAQDHGLSHSHLSSILSGRRIGTVAYLRKVAKAFHMTLDQFMRELDQYRRDIAS